jgi:glucose repression mediator protein
MMDELQQAYTAYQSALYNLRDPKVVNSVLPLSLHVVLISQKEPKLWYGIGILYDRYGSLDHAEEAFSQVMRMAPDFDKANEIYFRLGIIYKQQGKYQQSLEVHQAPLSHARHSTNSLSVLSIHCWSSANAIERDGHLVPSGTCL